MIRRVMIDGARAVPELDLVESPPGQYAVDEAYAFCERIARGHFDSYALARRFVPEKMRPHVWALYAFARTADDFADEPRYAGRRQELLDRWEHELERAFHRDAQHPIFVALADTIDRCGIPIAPLRNLLTGYAMDLSVTRYATSTDLDRHAAHTAVPVGRIFLYLFGQTEASLQRFVDEICVGLQLAKVCQDVALDLERDRIYLPAEDLRHFGVTEAMLRAERAPTELRDLLRYQVARARARLERGRPVLEHLRRVDASLAFQIALVFHAGLVILDRIEAAGFDVLSERPRLGVADKAEILARATAVRWPDAAVRQAG
jgi:hydroxysqualene synthase